MWGNPTLWDSAVVRGDCRVRSWPVAPQRCEEAHPGRRGSAQHPRQPPGERRSWRQARVTRCIPCAPPGRRYRGTGDALSTDDFGGRAL